MIKYKHTPGPWVAVGAWVEHPNDNVADICSCNPADFLQAHLGRSYDEQCSNARLIATAPELLTWARWAIDYVPEDVKNSYQFERLVATVNKAMGA